MCAQVPERTPNPQLGAQGQAHHNVLQQPIPHLTHGEWLLEDQYAARVLGQRVPDILQSHLCDLHLVDPGSDGVHQVRGNYRARGGFGGI
jgi:hypothetical protein